MFSTGANSIESYHRIFSAALVILMLFFFFVGTLAATEPLEVVITGIEGDTLKNVQETLVIPDGLVREGRVNAVWLQRFARQAVGKVETALEPFGYYQARITVSIEPEGEGSRLRVLVVPGEPVRLTDIQVGLAGPGSEEKPLLKLIGTFPLNRGDVLLHQRYEEFKGALLARAHELGYLDAEFSRHEIRIEKTATTAALNLTMNTGGKYSFGATRIQGAPDYPDSFLRRYLTYSEGQVFSSAQLGETQRSFTNSERFKEVIITPEKQDAKGYKIPVTVQLKEGSRISLRPGIGYGTDTGARFTVRYRDLDMFNRGHELNSALFVSEGLKGLVTGYTLPGSTDIKNSTTLQLNLQQEDTTTYTSRLLALELDRNRSFGEGRMGTAYVRAQYEDYSVGGDESTSRLLLPGLRFSADRYDNPVRPGQGFRYAFDLHGTDQVLGSDASLLQLLAEGKYIRQLPWRLSLQTRAKAGLTLTNDPIADIPPSLRFFTGGAQSVRGYSYQSLGPRDASGKVVGGKQLLTAGIELERALFSDWGISVFYDVGNAFTSFSGFSLYQGTGVGLHYYTSLGALNLSLAEPLGVDNPSLHIHFTVGFEL